MGCNSSKKKQNGENDDTGNVDVNGIKKNNNTNVKGALNNDKGDFQQFEDNEDDWLSQLKQEVNQSYIDEGK